MTFDENVADRESRRSWAAFLLGRFTQSRQGLRKDAKKTWRLCVLLWDFA